MKKINHAFEYEVGKFYRRRTRDGETFYIYILGKKYDGKIHDERPLIQLNFLIKSQVCNLSMYYDTEISGCFEVENYGE